MNNQPEMDVRAQAMWRDWEDGQLYTLQKGIAYDIPRCVRFFEGEQWPAPTERTKNLPRPVVNMVRMICRSKAAAILAARVRIVYSSQVPGVDTTPLNEMLQQVTQEMEQDALDRRAIGDATVKGTYVYHYYWDAHARGQDGRVHGGLRCELLDPLSVVFSDPCESDEQKQRWILISTFADRESVAALADADVDVTQITPDTVSASGEGRKLCRILTRYFRVGDEVYCERSVRGLTVNAPFALAPSVVENKAETAPLAGLYPIVVGQYEPREHSIYGLSEATGLIANQKALNFLLAMQILNVQQNAWSKYLVLPGALAGQVITNEPGQVLTDHSRTGNGIRRLESGDVGEAPLSLIQSLTQLTRTVSGTTEIMTGEILSSSMSGAAIAQLQSQAQQPIDNLRDGFWQVKVRQGRVIAQFLRLMYEDYPYFGTENRQNRVCRFSSKDWRGIPLDVGVEAVSGTRSSAAGDITVLDRLLESGKIDIETYLRAYPPEALSNRKQLLECVRTHSENHG